MPPASNTIVLKSLSVLLGLFFIFVGTLKLTPHISKDLYKDLVCVSWKIDTAGVLPVTRGAAYRFFSLLSHLTCSFKFMFSLNGTLLCKWLQKAF